MMKRIRRVLAGSALGLALALAMTAAPAAEAAARYVVDDDLAECPAAGYTGAAGLQDAITDAINDKVHTIEVCAGTYSSVVISGANGLKIYANDPDDPPHIDAPAADGGTIVDVQDSKNVTLDGLYLNGDPFVDNGLNDMNGVRYQNSSGVIQDLLIHHMASLPKFSAATARAISLIDDNGDSKTSSVKVTGTGIHIFQGDGIYGEGRVKVTLTGNTIIGQELKSENGWPNAGISLIANANGTPSGSILKNTLHRTGAGVRLNTVPKIKIAGNVIVGLGYGVYIVADCFAPGSSADKSRITGNQFIDMDFTLLVVATTTAASPCDSHADGLVFSGNTTRAYGNGHPTPIWALTSVAGTHTISIDGTVISRNTFWGYTGILIPSEMTNARVSRNTVRHW